MRKMINKKLLTSMLLIGCVSLAFADNATSNSQQAMLNNNKLNIENCHLDGIREQVKCGTLIVPENYSSNNSSNDSVQITINFAVLPAIDNSENKTPLMFLAGGPGQAAVELAAGLHSAFNEVRKTRDIILVDQRGTGQSHPLECNEIAANLDVYQVIPESFTAQEVQQCIETFSGDLSQYNSENAIRDFDAIRQALGHSKVNIYGGSYGTRAGLVYMRMFPDSLRSVVLDSVGPIEVPIGLFGQSSAKSFDLVLEHCQEEATCNRAYPNLRKEFEETIARLEQKAVTVTIAHPRLGTNTEFVISKGKFLGTLFQQLYSVPTRSMVPLVVHQAYLGNYRPLAGLIAVTDGVQAVYTGLLFNITCNEDFPRITPEMLAADADNDFGGDNSQWGFKVACSVWPQYRPDEAFYQPVTVNIPTLILSGGLDPVTPPSNGEFPAATLPNSHHIIADNISHGLATGAGSCGILMINEFLTSLEPKSLDQSCLEDIPAESFMTGLNGGVDPKNAVLNSALTPIDATLSHSDNESSNSSNEGTH